MSGSIFKNIPFPGHDQNVKAFTMNGVLREYSTKDLHDHSFHQILIIKNGISLLVDEKSQKPLYGTMCSFIPANKKHHTLVIGEDINYQSLYFDKSIFKLDEKDICIFKISNLGAALFDRLNTETITNLNSGILKDCLKLFLKIIKEDISQPVPLINIPVSNTDNSKKIINYIEKNYNKKLKLSHFQSILPYTTRHIARIFQKDLKVSIFQYIKLYRIFMSTVELLEKEKPIIEIAFDCGYDSLGNYYRDFKSYFAITPKHFRENL